MGKARNKISKGVRDNPFVRKCLAEQMTMSEYMEPREQEQGGSTTRQFKEEKDSEFADTKTTQKILRQARQQQRQLEDELSEKREVSNAKESSEKPLKQLLDITSDDEDAGEFEEVDRGSTDVQRTYADELQLDPSDELTIGLFMNKSAEPGKRLGDILKEKLTERKTEIETLCSDAGVSTQKLDPRVEKMYDGVREVLSRYRSGKLPKAFKVIPRLSNWEQILYLTDPNGWTAAAMYQATRIFTSNLKEKMAQRFFNLVLLPRIRDDIMEFKKLNFHLYQAIRKSLFKPGAFMKGFLIPLCEGGDCTLREAIIIGSVVAKNSIPLLHSAAAMLKIAEMDYSGANSIFLRIFMEKNYALPYRVIDALVFHFLRFRSDKRTLPVLWHQALLVLLQKYKDYISSEQKEALHGLLKIHSHYKITPEIRRELMLSKCRDESIQGEEDTIMDSDYQNTVF